ncbi:MAG TPA: glycosyltransferase family A protein [Actinomycetota bacterium]|nr:glycosyltransferase family A protein [Actinomycetota bacterium]
MSVVVPVRNRRDLLAATLDGLENQTYPDFEVVLVDDGSTDGSAELAAGRSIPVRVVRTAGVGAVGARCAGVTEAAGEILAFTDSDCVPEEGWIAAGVHAIDKDADVVQGVTLPAGPSAPLERSITHRGPEGLFATCNVFYRREAYEAAGGFDGTAGGRLGFRAGDEGRALGFGEDTLLGWRVARTGTSAIAQDAIVRHAIMKPSVKELLWRAWMTGGFPGLVREAPELRSSLLRQGLFLGYRRAPIYAMLATAALTRGSLRPLLAGAAFTWWTIARTRYAFRFRGSRKRRVAAVPVEMAVDAVTAAALVWGSARSRSVVL